MATPLSRGAGGDSAALRQTARLTLADIGRDNAASALVCPFDPVS
jgi:hypothetical protein